MERTAAPRKGGGIRGGATGAKLLAVHLYSSREEPRLRLQRRGPRRVVKTRSSATAISRREARGRTLRSQRDTSLGRRGDVGPTFRGVSSPKSRSSTIPTSGAYFTVLSTWGNWRWVWTGRGGGVGSLGGIGRCASLGARKKLHFLHIAWINRPTDSHVRITQRIRLSVRLVIQFRTKRRRAATLRTSLRPTARKDPKSTSAKLLSNRIPLA